MLDQFTVCHTTVGRVLSTVFDILFPYIRSTFMSNYHVQHHSFSVYSLSECSPTMASRIVCLSFERFHVTPFQKAFPHLPPFLSMF